MGSGCILSARFAAPRLSRNHSLTFMRLLQVQAGEVSKSAHPARFSPDDKYSSKATIPKAGKADGGDFAGHRVTLKKRYGLLLTQNSELTIVQAEGKSAD